MSDDKFPQRIVLGEGLIHFHYYSGIDAVGVTPMDNAGCAAALEASKSFDCPKYRLVLERVEPT